ncbi:MAG TPA: DNA methyltransferase, partial [Candidatus Hydrogenedentes bacterium]|nr:DNA methyltransferase [Candidatus Hydrogenedentota bacterium]
MQPVLHYLREIEEQLATGLATEHSHRAALQRLVHALGKDVLATNEPARTACGAPDYIVTRAGTIIGYIEAKDLGADLNQVERSEQLARYLDGLPNLILTDYLEFRLYHGGRFAMDARLARLDAKGALCPDATGPVALARLFDSFFTAAPPPMATPQNLAQRMAATARLLCEVIGRVLEDESETGGLHGQLEAFRRVLLHELEAAQFADMYAQTICYGLFAARCNHKDARGPFTREAAVHELPETNPFLRQMFGHIAGPELDTRLAWAVDQLAQMLDRADMGEILRDFGRRTRQEDPVVHFYETFLAAYDPSLRETRGVYYTPEPVVSYIVRSVDGILKRDFGIEDGLAATDKVPVYETHVPNGSRTSKAVRKKVGEVHKVLILDPAAGTGTFLHGVVDQIHETVVTKRGKGIWNGYVSEHLLPRLFGFELLMAPYAVAHMKLGIQLAETGYAFQSGERLRVYLTNTLEEAFELGGLPLFAHIIAEEANAAGRVKTRHPVMVVLGNPPYSGHSANKGAWIAHLLRGTDTTSGERTGNYFEVDGQPLGERNPKWLNDDYVKFIRFAQWRIERTGYGILAFISNHSYLDNPTFRGMRQSLMETFDDIYLLDLHGNAKKKEVAPDGSKDENVFDIQQGVAIGIFVKRKNGPKRRLALVRHADLWGARELYERTPDGAPRLVGGKHRALYDSNVKSTKWTRLKPESPFYLFVPQDTKRLEEYKAGRSIPKLMPVNCVGIVTARDVARRYGAGLRRIFSIARP